MTTTVAVTEIETTEASSAGIATDRHDVVVIPIATETRTETERGTGMGIVGVIEEVIDTEMEIGTGRKIATTETGKEIATETATATATATGTEIEIHPTAPLNAPPQQLPNPNPHPNLLQEEARK